MTSVSKGSPRNEVSVLRGTATITRPTETLPKHEEVHIACEDDWDVALCGKKRDKPWRYGDPFREATCAVCLDLYEVEVFGG